MTVTTTSALNETQVASRGGNRMLEYVAYALLGLLTIGCLLYVTTSPEVEDAPKSKRSDSKQ